MLITRLLFIGDIVREENQRIASLLQTESSEKRVFIVLVDLKDISGSSMRNLISLSSPHITTFVKHFTS